MNKKGQFVNTGLILMLAFGVIISLVFIQEIANTQNKLTDLQPIGDETFNINTEGCLTTSGQVNETAGCNLTLAQWTTYDSDWRTTQSQCYPSSIVVSNSSGTALTLDTDYTVVASSGLVNMLNTTDTVNSTMGNSILIDYNYCDAGYNADSGSRGIARLFVLFCAFILLAFVIIGVRDWI